MSEPKEYASRVEEIIPGVFRWCCKDDRIGGNESDAYAVRDDAGRAVLIDPLPIEPSLLLALGDVEAIVLSAGNHQRAAWTMRQFFQVPVWAPENAYGLERKADHAFSGGDLLPGRLAAIHTPGPVESMYAFWRARPVGVVFLSDLLTHDGSGRLSFIDSQYQDEPWRTRASVRRILEDVPSDVLCFAHGPPLLEGAMHALQQVLADDTEHFAQNESP